MKTAWISVSLKIGVLIAVCGDIVQPADLDYTAEKCVALNAITA